MVGSNIAIARLAAMSLLDTLQENDFVNVVVVVSVAFPLYALFCICCLLLNTFYLCLP